MRVRTPRGEKISPTTTLSGSTAPVPTSVEGATIPPINIHVPPPALGSGFGISDGDLRGAIQMLTQLVASQAQRSNVAPSSSSQQGDSTSFRVNRFLQLDPPVFTSANPEEDPQDFIDEMHKTLRVMHATETEGVELAAYRLKGVDYSWFELWEDSHEEGSPPARWSEIADAFVDYFLPVETRAARAVEFENLKQGSRSVLEFSRRPSMPFTCCPQWRPGCRFVQSLNPLTINEASTVALNSDMNYGKMVAFAQATENRKLKNKMERERGKSKARSLGNMGESLGEGRSAFRGGSLGPSQSVAQSSASTPPSGPSQQQQWSRFRPSQAPAGRGAARGGAQNSEGPSRFYAMSGCQTAEASPNVVTSILTIQSHDVYALIDPGSTLSYVTPFVFMEFRIESNQLHEPFSVSTPVGEYIVATRVYRGCVVMVHGRDTMTDLIEVGMVDFDVIMEMDWL
ncbi:uncharacterized protein [Nicotiana sylvestris]|uniref:uncharacterized protein n=1 Tax=Nicotiana sylvestris TaxID=4096 RepID=UPI00388C5B71